MQQQSEQTVQHGSDSITGSVKDPAKTSISVIIPTLNAGNKIIQLLDTLKLQRRKPDEILVIDSSSDDGSVQKIANYHGIKLITISREEFNHGKTRDMAVRHTHGDFILFLTQDALPQDTDYIAHLLEPFRDPSVAMVSGRQIARDDARPFERLVREYNYPAKSYTRCHSDIQRMGIKAFFASDVCSAYRRKAYLQVGGFERVTTNEDMFIAATFLRYNWKVAYCAEAIVIHSHNFTLQQQYRRNYAMGREIQLHQHLLGNVPLNSEGKSLVKYVVSKLISNHRYLELASFILDCASRLLGNAIGTCAGKKEQRKITESKNENTNHQ